MLTLPLFPTSEQRPAGRVWKTRLGHTVTLDDSITEPLMLLSVEIEDGYDGLDLDYAMLTTSKVGLVSLL